MSDDVGARSGPRAPSRPRTTAVLVAAGLLLAALNLRLGVASVGPVLSRIQDELGLTETVASLLTTIPVACFGAFAFLTPTLARRWGLHRCLAGALVLVVAGILLRLPPGMVGLFAGTTLLGAAIAVANVAMPAVIKLDLPHRSALMTGLYSTALSLSGAAGAGLTVPLLGLTGDRWRPALALWAVPAGLAVVAMLPRFCAAAHHVSSAAPPSTGAPAAVRTSWWRPLVADPVALAVTGYMGAQSLGYYAFLTWTPTLLQDAGVDAGAAGWLLSWSALAGIPASLAAPALARRVRPRWLAALVPVLLVGGGYLGLATAPAAGSPLWMALLGLGMASSLSLALSYIVWRAPDVVRAGHLSTLAQGVGYLLAALGPLGVGALRGATGGWGLALGALGGVLVLQLVAGVVAGRERWVLTGRVEQG